jgi:tRNA(Ile)-lysidine synthase
VSIADGAVPLDAAEAEALFADLANHPVLLLAVSGGADSTALMWLVARWRKALMRGPKLVAITVDHGLRKEARAEASAVARLARKLGVTHRTLRWRGRKPATGLPEAARIARYRLLAEAAKKSGSRHVLTAHTLDDQAETVLMRLARGSGLAGLAAMAAIAPLPGGGSELSLVRPLLDVPKARLVATLRQARVPFAEDPTNRDPRFTRARLRAALPALGREGLSPPRLALLALRARRADAALEQVVSSAWTELMPGPWPEAGPFKFDATAYCKLSAEVSLRLLGRAIARAGNEGPVELGKLETLHAMLAGSPGATRIRRTLAGAIVTWDGGRLTVERAPARHRRPPRNGLNQSRRSSVKVSARDARLG